MSTLPFVLRRVHADDGEEAVSEYPTFEAGWRAGQRARNTDPEHAFALYRGNTLRATFAHLDAPRAFDADPKPAILGALL